ncbi:MAG: hypothetical protein ABEH35_08930, partial [Haloarculaceae archaeon]
MRPTSALAVALLVVASIAVPAGAADASPDAESSLIVTVESGTNYLTIPADDVRTTGFDDSGLDVSAAVATESRALHARHQQLQFRSTFTGADEAARTRIVQRQIDRIEDRVSVLQRRHRSSITAYADGEMSASAFLRQRVLIDSEARLLYQRVQRIKQIANAVGDYTLPTSLDVRLENAKGRLEALQGPVSSRIARSFAGSAGTDTVYLEASGSGYSMGVVTSDGYVRETYLGAERAPNATDQFTQGDTHRINAANT